jgi:hypothetical protein
MKAANTSAQVDGHSSSRSAAATAASNPTSEWAPWAEPSALAGETSDHRVAAATTREISGPGSRMAAQVCLELVDDELGQSAGLLGSPAEARPMLGDDSVEQRPFGSTALVAVTALR